MKFSKVLGRPSEKDVSPEELAEFDKVVDEAAKKLSAVFTELSIKYDNKTTGSGWGGDPLVFQLTFPNSHICDARELLYDIVAKKAGEEAASKQVEEIAPEDLKKYFANLKNQVLRTAATDGKRYFWNPLFINKHDKLSIRIVLCHEAWHSIYMHPARRGFKHPKLWNIAVDFKVNYTITLDLKNRGIKEPEKTFKEYLGDYIRLEEYAAFLRDPYNPPERLAHLNPIHNLRSMADPAYVHPGENHPPMYYNEPELPETMKRPEDIYNYLYAQIPRCPDCGKVWYKKPDEAKELQKKLKQQQKEKEEQKTKEKAKKAKSGDKSEEQSEAESEEQQAGSNEEQPSDEHSHGEDGEPCDHDCSHDHSKQMKGQKGQGQESDEPSDQKSEGKNEGEGEGESSEQHSCQGHSDKENQEESHGCKCPTCGGKGDSDFDPFGVGDTLDDHIETDISEEELAKKVFEAMEMAKKLAGKIPGALEDELGTIISPKLRWQDVIRQKILKKRRGVGKNDWQSPKHRPMRMGLYIPKKQDHFLNILAAYDCSGSMSSQDIAYGVSQLQVIDDRGEIFLLPWDTVCYWNDMIKIKKANAEELKKTKVKGRGGTMVGDVFRQYKKHCGPVDMIIVMTDGFIGDYELKDVKLDRNIDVLWLITSDNKQFKPPFGRVFHIKNN